jgi:hypothetical protein
MCNTQKLIDVMFQVGLLTKSNSTLQNMTDEEYAAWLRGQLFDCTGIKTGECGASWASIDNN